VPLPAADEESEALVADTERLVIFEIPEAEGVELLRDGDDDPDTDEDNVETPPEDDGKTVVDEDSVELSPVGRLIIHARVYGLADFYDMPEPRDHAVECFRAVGGPEPRDIAPKGFANVARDVCKTFLRRDGGGTPELPKSALREAVLRLVAIYADELSTEDEFLNVLREESLQALAGDVFIALRTGSSNCIWTRQGRSYRYRPSNQTLRFKSTPM
jgi:hypothetical protein